MQVGQTSTVAAIHNRTTDLDIDSVVHSDPSFEPKKKTR
jgi:hypothetical protein